MRAEYEAIVAAGLLLQLDAPDLGLGRHMMYNDRTDDEYLALIARHVEVLNHALRNVPADRVRMHVCWGNYEGPHTYDVRDGTILPIAHEGEAGGAAVRSRQPAPRARVEVFRRHASTAARRQDPDPRRASTRPPTSSSIRELVAERIAARSRTSSARERVIAGTDCGFATFAGFGAVDPDIVYAKLGALAEGAALASERLWRAAA